MPVPVPLLDPGKRPLQPLLISGSSRPSPTHSPKPSPGLTPNVSALLPHFANPGVAPPSARVDPTLKIGKPEPPVRLWDIWKYGWLAAGKGLELAMDVFSHHISGPRRKSWGIEMTIVNSLARDASSHSHLFDIKFMRSLMSLSGLVPIPSDALVTPVTFKVRKRKLRGILQDWDALEDGKRELTGEWVIGRRLWRKLQSEWQKNKVGKEKPPDHHKNSERIVLYVHGGAYFMFDAITHRLISIPLSKHVNARVFSINYRLAPETKFPGPLHDVVSSYFRLVDDLQIPPSNIIVAGDSAGGALCLALMMYLRDNDYPLPGAAILLSPWVDLTMSCESWDSNAKYDVLSKPIQGGLLDPITCYLGEHMEKYLTHPYASPLFGNFTGLPPMLIQAGDAEVLRDEITLLAYKASLAGVKVRHELYEDAVHVFHTYPFLEVSRRAFLSCREFVKFQLPEWQTSSPEALGGQTEQEMEEEIDNHDAKVVDGDGVEVPLEDVVDSSWAGESSQDESSSERESREDTHSSWIKLHDDTVSSPWPSPPPSDDEDLTEPDTASKAPRSPSTQINESRWPSPLKHLQSTLYSMMQAASTSLVGGGSSQPQPDSFQPSSQITPTSTRFKMNGDPVMMVQTPTPDSPTNSSTKRNHRRTPSSQYPLRGSLTLNGSTSGASGFLSIEPHEQAPPRPEVRRMTSHPDVSSLCDSWANTEPANQTVNFYKTSPSSFLNTASLAFTQPRPNGSTSTTRGGGQEGKNIQATRKSVSGLFFTPASSQH
ncbi:hypothetical protein BJ322DRAFT_1099369 [Thelephora terrestris]|uniref:Alpha/beta hydrolase fold-3 domain-containing protein n=1 Tax=Thelephora terrestris TaxID=56493 RepID=A0A9P6HK93_9AGAM|nr:hypothetical protein BJ322DRAFT_1099369 [Thelephora terrestris]